MSEIPWEQMTEAERRLNDRRRRPTPMFSRYTIFGGRRRHPQRCGEREGSFVDLYGAEVLAVFLLVMALNTFDSFFTLVYLQRGGLEANPMVQLLLNQGMVVFLVAKTAVIGLALGILCVCKNFRHARIGIQVSLWAYSLLAAYHIFLFYYRTF